MSLTKVTTFVGLFVFAAFSGRASIVSEHEPNNDLDHPNAVQCGDTVQCARLSPHGDLDHFRFYAYAGDSVVLSTFYCNGRVTNTLMVLYDDHHNFLAEDDNNGLEWFSEIHWRVLSSGNYVVRIMQVDVGPADSAYSFTVVCPLHESEAYDLCTTPRVIPSLPYYDDGSTFGATSQCGTASPDVFYTFHNPVTSNLYIAVCSDLWDARVQILGGCCTDEMDDANEGCNRGAVLYSYSIPPGDFFIMVEGQTAGDAGFYSIVVAADRPPCPPPGPVVLATVGGHPFLDWPELAEPSYFVIWQSNSCDGPWEHLGTTTQTFYTDSTGYTGLARYYYVTSVCAW